MKSRITKVLSLTISVLLVVATCLTLCACNDNKFNEYDIVVEPYGGSGFGLEWLESLANEWNAKQPSDSPYRIKLITNSTTMSGDQVNQIASGLTQTDIFYSSEVSSYPAGFYKGYFEDLSDMLDVKPEGTRTIREKIIDFNSWEKVARKIKYNQQSDSFEYGQEFYMLPNTITMTGLVYDHDYFVSKNLLDYATVSDKSAIEAQGITCSVQGERLEFVSATGEVNYEEGDYILSAGKDGKYGTYDDGQPQTMAEFEKLCANIKANGGIPITYSSLNEYASCVSLAYFVQYAGLDAYKAITSFDTNGAKIALYDGSETAVNWQNGYLAYKAIGVAEMVNFSDKYFNDEANASTAFTVTDAQNNYITGIVGGSTRWYGMICEGNWFEHEASQTIKNAAKSYGGTPYGQGDYRFMLIPAVDGQKGLDGQGNGSVVVGVENGGIAVRKQSDSAKLAKIKDFIAYTLTDKALADTTASCGLIRGYSYQLSDNQLNDGMTVFQRNCYQMYQDTANVKVLTSLTDRLTAPFAYAATGFNETIFSVNAQSVVSALFTGTSATTAINAIYNTYSAEKWNAFYNQIKSECK